MIVPLNKINEDTNMAHENLLFHDFHSHIAMDIAYPFDLSDIKSPVLCTEKITSMNGTILMRRIYLVNNFANHHKSR